MAPLLKKLQNLDPAMPNHIGIIMDGNGRWAQGKKLPRAKGHLAGIDAAKIALQYALSKNVQYITLYVFSTENWSRPRAEVSFILDMVAGKLREHYSFYKEHKIRIVHSGFTEDLGKKIQNELSYIIEDTKHYSNLVLNLAFNYGGRDEIIRAFKRYLKDTQDINTAHSEISEEVLSRYLDQPDIPYPDLIIRTGMHKRLSNFLLWQSAYAELYLSDTLWPDWSRQCMEDALKFYAMQKRNFGGIS